MMMMMMMMMMPLMIIMPNATKGYVTAIQGGSVMGLPLVTMGLLMLQLLILALSKRGNFDTDAGEVRTLAWVGIVPGCITWSAVRLAMKGF